MKWFKWSNCDLITNFDYDLNIHLKKSKSHWINRVQTHRRICGLCDQ